MRNQSDASTKCKAMEIGQKKKREINKKKSVQILQLTVYVGRLWVDVGVYIHIRCAYVSFTMSSYSKTSSIAFHFQHLPNNIRL